MSEVLGQLWGAFWFFLPAGVANMSPVLANKIPILNRWQTPIDFCKSFHGKRIFGDHKTWRGLVFGVLMGAVVALVQQQVDLGLLTAPVVVGAIMGFGALMGDALKSFFKRRVGVQPGSSWFPFDQLDYIIGGLIVICPFVRLPITDIASIGVIYFSLHLLTVYAGYLLGFKDKPI